LEKPLKTVGDFKKGSRGYIIKFPDIRLSESRSLLFHLISVAGGSEESTGYMFICRDVVENIMDYIDNELDLKTLQALEKHTGECPECKAFVDTYRRMLDLSGKMKEQTFVTPEVRERLRNLLKSRMKPC